MIVKSIRVQDYSSGKEYVYTDKSGSAKSIKAVDGQIGAGPQAGSGNSPAQQPSSGSSYNAPSNTGRQVSSTSKSEPTQNSVSGSNADSSESTPNSASQPPSSSSPAGANYIATGGSTAGSGNTGNIGAADKTPDSAAQSMAITTAGIVVAAAGLIAGWIL